MNEPEALENWQPSERVIARGKPGKVYHIRFQDPGGDNRFGSPMVSLAELQGGAEVLRLPADELERPPKPAPVLANPTPLYPKGTRLSLDVAGAVIVTVADHKLVAGEVVYTLTLERPEGKLYPVP